MSKNTSLDIALIASHREAEQIITLIKSICFYHSQVRFHIINQDIHEEWFSLLNDYYLQQLNSEAINIPVTEDILQFYPQNNSVSPYGYLKMMIPQTVDAQRVLYLHHDCLVNGSLTSLYETDLEGFAFAAVEDLFLNHSQVQHANFPQLKPYFNTGMLLFNTPLCGLQTPYFTQLTRALQEQQKLSFAEQDILNLVCVQRWKEVDKRYNLQVGIERLFKEHQVPEWGKQALDLAGDKPAIVQYSYAKPWQKDSDDTPFHELYWFYYSLDWEDIIQKAKKRPSF